MKLKAKVLSSGYWHVGGTGPCNWAQWPVGQDPTDEDVFPEASDEFRVALQQWWDSDAGAGPAAPEEE